MARENRPGIGVTEEMVRAFVEGKAEALKVTVTEWEDPKQVWAVIQGLLVKFPNVKAVTSKSAEANEILFYKQAER